MNVKRIDPRTMTVNEAIRRYPATVAIFDTFGIDACCGGAVPIAEAAVRDGADPVRVAEALARVVEEAAA